MAAKASGLDLDEFNAWSSRGENFSERDTASLWRSIKRGDGIGPGTLFAQARRAGWRDPQQRVQGNAHRSETRHRDTPQQVWDRGLPATQEHPYIVAKGGAPDGLRVVPEGDSLRIAGASVAGWLVVPVRSLAGDLVSLQFIPPPGHGKKLNMPGAPMKGVFVVGELSPGAVVHIVEGVGQGWAAWRASGHPSVVTFGAGRMRAVATELRGRDPAARITLVPDVGKEPEANDIARDVAGLVARMPAGWRANADVADLALRDGSDALEALLADARAPDPSDSELQCPRTLPFVQVPIADLYHFTPPAPEHVWQDYIPTGVVTLLGAHGGTGKSFFALQLAVCVALGVPCLGVPTKRCIVVVFSAEDNGEILRYRLHWICKALAIDPRSLEGWLHVLDATGGDPTLYAETQLGGVRAGRTTPSHDALSALVRELGAGLLIVDNASDVFAASEIDRARVREFVRALARIAQENGAGVLLLAHISKVKARGLDGSAESYSGSTAWHNSARSRLALDRSDDGLVLKQEKANFGPMREPLAIAWPKAGVMHVVEAPSGMMAVIVDRNETTQLLRLIHEFTERGEYVSTATTSRTHAGKLLGRESNYPKGLDDARLFDLLRTAERKGLLARETYRGADRKIRERWQITPQGIDQAGIAATAATCATSVVAASGASGAEPAATAATSPPGGVGEERAHKSPQIEGAR